MLLFSTFIRASKSNLFFSDSKGDVNLGKVFSKVYFSSLNFKKFIFRP